MQTLLQRCALGRLAFVALLTLFLPLPAASAKEGGDVGAYDVRVFHIGALTGGRSAFIGERRAPVEADDAGDESRPLFGGVSEEGEAPFGGVDEIITLLQSLMAPEVWGDGTDGAYLLAQGDHALFAKHRPEVLDEVARLLADLEHRALTTVTVELQAVRSSSLAAKDAEAAPNAAAVLAGEGRGPFLALTGFLGQRISGWNGGQAAYVLDYDVEVAKNAKISDPIVAVANLGLRADVCVLPAAGDGPLHADVQAWLAATAERPEISTGAQRPIEAWGFDVTDVAGVVAAQAGVWTLVPARGGEHGWSFFLRLTPHPWRATPAHPASLRIPAPSAAAPRHALYDMRDLAAPMTSRRGGHVWLTPSNYTPPEPPELQEPLPAMDTEELIALLQRAAPKGAPWAPGALGEVGRGMLLVRGTPEVVAGVAQVLAAVRQETLVSLRTRADLVELPAALFERLRGGADGVPPEAAAALARALKDGSARRLERLELKGRPGVRTAVTAGRTVSYLADYEVEIADGAAIANPIVQSFLVGAQLEVTPHLTGDRRGVALEVEFARTEHEGPIRRAETPTGSLMLPALSRFHVRAGLVVPLGRSVLLGAQGEGPMRRALLLTTRIVPTR